MVSLKVINYNKTKGLTYSNLTYLININYEHSLNVINAIRRTIISKVPTLAFEPSIMEFTINSSVFNNDQLRERFSQLPILNYDTNTYFINPISDYLEYVNSNEYHNTNTVSLYINAKNTTNDIISITTNDIKYQINNKTVDNPYNKDYPIILVKLKKDQEISCKLSGVIGIGKQDNIWSPVSNCILTYDNENELKLSVNSQGQINEFVIIDKAIDNIIFNLNLNTNKIKSYISTVTDKIDSFNITLDDSTIGKLLNDQLQLDKRVKYAGIYQPSYLESYIKIKIDLDDKYSIKEIDSILEENNNKLIKIYQELKQLNLEQMKKYVK